VLLVFVVGNLLTGTQQPACEAQEPDASSICLPDEQQAMRRYKQDPSPANRTALARVRCFRALDLAALSQAAKNPDLLEIAAVYAESCTQLAPDAAWSWTLFGRLLRAVNNDITGEALAEQAFTRALEIEPTNAEALVLRGTTLAGQERWDEAVDDLEAALSTPGVAATPNLVTLLTNAYLLAFESARGERFLAARLATDPTNDAARLARAILVNHCGDREGALAELARVQARKGAAAGLRTYARVLRASFGAAEEAGR